MLMVSHIFPCSLPQVQSCPVKKRASTLDRWRPCRCLPPNLELLHVRTQCSVMLFTRSGWPLEVSPEVKPFYHRRNELTVEGNCLLWGTRVVVPMKLQGTVLQELHRDHTGMERTKSIARSYVWWPGMDVVIEELVEACEACQSVKSAPPVAPLHPWVWPEKPWQRILLDLSVVGCSCFW